MKRNISNQIISLVGAICMLFLFTTSVAQAEPMRTIKLTPQKLAAGKATFQMCAACHGQDAEGRVGIGPRLASKSYLSAASDAFLVATIKEGRAGTTMIPWGGALQQEQIESVVVYLRSLAKVKPVKLDDSPLKGDAKAGQKVFDSMCYTCHGKSGAGYQETANGTGIGRKGFLDTASNGFLRYIIKHGKDQTKMRGFSRETVTAVANLTSKEIENVIAYLRSKAW
jgi:cbb3-type cytochrome c oxidase subunit III